MSDLGNLRKHLRVLDWAMLALIVGGFVLFVADALFSIPHGDPFPTFGETKLDAMEKWITPVLAVAWLAWAAQLMFRAARVGLDARSLIIVYVASALATYLSAGGWELGLELVNGALDFGPGNPTEIIVREKHETKYASFRFGTSSHLGARVSRIDHPQERVGIPWDECQLPKGVYSSPRATLVFHPGLFGAPWYDPRIGCRPLQLDEVALFESFHVGRGRPLAIFALPSRGRSQIAWDQELARKRELVMQSLRELAGGDTRIYQGETINWSFDSGVRVVKNYADELSSEEWAGLEKVLEPMRDAPKAQRRKQGDKAIAYAKQLFDSHSEGPTIALWLKALEASGANVKVAVVRAVSPPGLPDGLDCPSCSSLVARDLDNRVLGLLTGAADLWDHTDFGHVWVVDGKGQQLLKTELSDIGRIPALQRALAATAATASDGKGASPH